MAVSDRSVDEPVPTATGIGAILGVDFVGQAVSGGIVLLLLTLHMVAQHFIVPNGLRNFAEVVDYMRSPVFVVLEVLFLVVVTWHAMLGVRAIIFDWGLSARAERIVTWVLSVIGLGTVVYGLWLTGGIVSKG